MKVGACVERGIAEAASVRCIICNYLSVCLYLIVGHPIIWWIACVVALHNLLKFTIYLIQSSAGSENCVPLVKHFCLGFALGSNVLLWAHISHCCPLQPYIVL